MKINLSNCTGFSLSLFVTLNDDDSVDLVGKKPSKCEFKHLRILVSDETTTEMIDT
jgi:hypothetical protein